MRRGPALAPLLVLVAIWNCLVDPSAVAAPIQRRSDLVNDADGGDTGSTSCTSIHGASLALLRSCRAPTAGVVSATTPRLATAALLQGCFLRNTSGTPGVRPLRVVGPDSAVMRELARLSDESFSQITGVPINWVYMNLTQYSAERQPMLRDPNPPTADRGYDALLATPTAFGDAATVPGKLLDLSYMVLNDKQLDWSGAKGSGVQEQFRSQVTFNGSVVALPLIPAPQILYYHLGIFQRDNLTVPQTWEELADLAERYHGRDGMIGACLMAAGCRTESFVLRVIFGSYVQTMGPAQGVFWDTTTLEPLVNTPAMEAALKVFRRLRAVGPNPNVPFSCSRRDFVNERCLLSMQAGVEFKTANFQNFPIKGKMGMALLPGSTHVLDRRTKTLVQCTKSICPAAIGTAIVNGRQVPVNRPIGASTSIVLFNGLSPPQYAFYAYNLFSWLASPSIIGTRGLLTRSNELMPVRAADVDPANVPLWVDAGCDRGDTERFLAIHQQTASISNVNGDLKIRLTANVTNALLEAALTYNNVSLNADVHAVMANLEAALNGVVAHEGRNAFAEQYRRSLNYYGPLGFASTDGDVSGEQGGGDDDGGAHVTTVALAVAIPCGLAVLAVAVLLVLWARRRQRGVRWGLLGSLPAPGPAAATTLLVSDIQDSTLLWEALKPEVMDAALKLHHRVIRNLLLQHSGYESATEGDSFILAFPDPTCALLFALEAQQALLECPWPSELLVHPPLPHQGPVEPHDDPAAEVALVQRPVVRQAAPLTPVKFGKGSIGRGGTPFSRTSKPDAPAPQQQHPQQSAVVQAHAHTRPAHDTSAHSLLGGMPARAAAAAGALGGASRQSMASPLSLGPFPADGGEQHAGTAAALVPIGPSSPPQPSRRASPWSPCTHSNTRTHSPSSLPAGSSLPVPEGVSPRARTLGLGVTQDLEVAVAPFDAYAHTEHSASSGQRSRKSSLLAGLGLGRSHTLPVQQPDSNGSAALEALAHATSPVALPAALPAAGGSAVARSRTGPLVSPHLRPPSGCSTGNSGAGMLARAVLGSVSAAAAAEAAATRVSGVSSLPAPVHASGPSARSTDLPPLTQGSSSSTQPPTHSLAPEVGPPACAAGRAEQGSPSQLAGHEPGVPEFAYTSGDFRLLPDGVKMFSRPSGGGTGPAGATVEEALVHIAPERAGGFSPVRTPTWAATLHALLSAQFVPVRAVGQPAASAAVGSPVGSCETCEGSSPRAAGAAGGGGGGAVVGLEAGAQAPGTHPASGAGAAAAGAAPGGAGTNAGGGAAAAAGSAPTAAGGSARKADVRTVVFRGLRVRMGLHSGVLSASDITRNAASGRTQYSGTPLRLAKAVADAAHGGQVLLSQSARDVLADDEQSAGLKGLSCVLLYAGRHTLSEELPDTHLFQCTTRALVGRLVLQRPLRTLGCSPLLPGALAAPLGTATVARLSVVGADTLLAWNYDVASYSLALLYEALLDELQVQLAACPSAPYIVEGGQGLYSSAAAAAAGQAASGAPGRTSGESGRSSWPMVSHPGSPYEHAPRDSMAGRSSNPSGALPWSTSGRSLNAVAARSSAGSQLRPPVAGSGLHAKHSVGAAGEPSCLAAGAGTAQAGAGGGAGGAPGGAGACQAPPMRHSDSGASAGALSGHSEDEQSLWARNSTGLGAGAAAKRRGTRSLSGAPGPDGRTGQALPLSHATSMQHSDSQGAASRGGAPAPRRSMFGRAKSGSGFGKAASGRRGEGGGGGSAGRPGVMTVLFPRPDRAAVWLLRVIDLLPCLEWPWELLRHPLCEELQFEEMVVVGSVNSDADMVRHRLQRRNSVRLQPNAGLLPEAPGRTLQAGAAADPTAAAASAAAGTATGAAGLEARGVGPIAESSEIEASDHDPRVASGAGQSTGPSGTRTAHSASGSVPKPSGRLSSNRISSTLTDQLQDQVAITMPPRPRPSAPGSLQGGSAGGAGRTSAPALPRRRRGNTTFAGTGGMTAAAAAAAAVPPSWRAPATPPVGMLFRGLRVRAALVHGDLGGELPTAFTLGGQPSYKGKVWSTLSKVADKAKAGEVCTNAATVALLPPSLSALVAVRHT